MPTLQQRATLVQLVTFCSYDILFLFILNNEGIEEGAI